MRFVDTNVFLRYFTADHSEQSERAAELFLSIEQGDEQVQTSQVVILETVFTLQTFYQLPLLEVRDKVIPILLLDGIRLEQKAMFEPAFELAIEKNINFQDAFNAIYMRSRDLSEVYSWDRHFDRVDGITRIEPGAATPS